MIAGLRFLSVGLIIKFLSFLSVLRAASCVKVRLEIVLFSFLELSWSWLNFRVFSNAVIFSSIEIDAGGGSHCLFFTYICLVYVDIVDELDWFK